MQEYEGEMEYADFAETLERASGARDFVTSLYFDKLFSDNLRAKDHIMCIFYCFIHLHSEFKNINIYLKINLYG